MSYLFPFIIIISYLLFEWLPFSVDDKTGQRSRKWLTHKGDYFYGDGEVLDILQFIPKTAKNEERKKILTSQAEMDSLERWVLNNTGDGNRNNMLHRYAMIMVDAGADFQTVADRVTTLNNKLAGKLDDVEIHATILKSVPKAIERRDGGQ